MGVIQELYPNDKHKDKEQQARPPGSGVAGVRRGDVITALGDSELVSYRGLLGALRDYQPGDTARLTVFRDGEEKKLGVTLDERR